jgi:uncharacterized protein YbjT (DUF2867 family)
MAHILVTGATGYIGGRLIPELLDAGHQIRCLVRTPAKLGDRPWHDDVEVVQGDVTDEAACRQALRGIDTAYYLVHSMGTGSEDFADVDRQAAATFRDAAAAEGVGRIVYLGGLGRDEDPRLSRHLQSRHEVGRVLADGDVPLVELRAAVIIGSGSASFEMLRYLVEVLPVMITPRWVENRCQPIAVRDVLAWLVHAATRPSPDGSGHDVVEIGGPDVVTYRELMDVYAREAGLTRRRVFAVPVLTPALSSLWIGLVTPLPTGLARPLVESLINEVVVVDRPPDDPTEGTALTVDAAVERALRRATELQVSTRWSDAALPGRSSADPLPSDPDWAGGSLVVDERHASSAADPDAVFRVILGIGGERGWYAMPLLWEIRGALDVVAGGVGTRRGRRHPDEIVAGEALDLWRVEEVRRPELVRLRAEMRMPGDAWLEWNIERDGDGAQITQRAIFAPRGLWGRAYWYGLVPFHALIFGRMARRLASTAEVASNPTGTG